MPKSIVIKPEDIKSKEDIYLSGIPVNTYNKSFAEELKKYGKDLMIDIYYNMCLIREFEYMLDAIKIEGSYKGIEYNHPGAAHLSVGQSLMLDIDDFIFGSHRSHGEMMAKSFSVIRQSEENEIRKIMEDFSEGRILSVVEKHFPGDSTKDVAEHFVLYGMLAEIFAKSTGFNYGMGGSMHSFFVPYGCMPNNAIVGGSADIAVGAALFKKVNRKNGIVIANIGDGAMGCGPVWEALCMAAMDQYNTLWDDMPGAPPFMLNIQNNFYGMGGQTKGETMGYGYPARIGEGVNPSAMHSERIDGLNPLAVAEAVARKKQILKEGKGPVMLETTVYRLARHSQSDPSTYRTEEEIKAFQETDCIRVFAEQLLEHKILSKSEVEDIHAKVNEKILRVTEVATNIDISPRENEKFIEGVMFSHKKIEAHGNAEPDVLIPLEENPRLKQIAKKSRYGYDQNGKPLSSTKVYAIRDAIFEAMIHRFYKDPTMIAYGEENRDWGGAYACYRGLTEALPYHRLFNSPISEAAIVGTGVGYALSGGRAVVELMFGDFLGRAGDEIFNQMPKWQGMSGGVINMPLILRIAVGNKYGAQHSQDWSSIVTHIPGLQVMYPVTPYDAKGMLALAHSDPVVFFECQQLYGKGEMFVETGVPEEYYEVPLGEPSIKREGSDITICTIGYSLYEAIKAADILEKEYQLSAEVISLRFLNPLNYIPLVESVQKTGRLLVVGDACERGSFIHTVSSNMGRLAFHSLDAPVVALGARNWIVPCAELEDVFFPRAQWILDAIHEDILPLKNHVSQTVQSTEEVLRRNKLGV